jgi:hypothetical protein
MMEPVASSSGVDPRGSKSRGRSGTTSARGTASKTSSGRLVVELDEGHAGVVAVGLLLGEQAVEPATTCSAMVTMEPDRSSRT